MEAHHVAIDDEAAFLKIAALIALLPTFLTVPFVGGLSACRSPNFDRTPVGSSRSNWPA